MSAVPAARGSRRFGVRGLLATVLALYLLSPAFTSQHVEGFSAQIQSMALILAEQGSVAGHDLARPLVTQFIFFTRSGVVDLLALGDRLFGYTGDLGFRLLTLSSLVGLMAACAWVAARHARVPAGVALFVCVLTPGLVELGFYFNDNVVSAAFAALALGAVALRNGTVGALLAGVAMGVAVACRIDAVLAAPLVFLVFLLRAQSLAAASARLLLMAGTAAAVLASLGRFNGGDLLDALRIAGVFTERHLAGHGRLPGKAALLYFFGLPVAALVVLGARDMWRERPSGWRRWAWIAAFYAYPVVVMLYVLRTTLEIRYFLPLLGPVVALHGGRGLVLACAWAADAARRRKGLALALGVVVAAWLLMPPAGPLMRDGPRILAGRLWSPVLWWRWQDTVADSRDTTGRAVDALAAQGLSTVVTTHWNDEFYIRLRLFEAGYREVPTDGACRALSRYVAGSRVVWHVRLDPQYGLPPFETPLATALPLAALARCPEALAAGRVELTRFGTLQPDVVRNGIDETSFGSLPGRVLAETLGENVARNGYPVLSYPVMGAAAMPVDRLAALAAQAGAVVAVEGRALGQDPDALIDRYRASFAAR